jgi:hypothetical protein
LNSSELAVTLGFAHLLHDDLLGGLGGDAAEIHRRQRSAMKSPTCAAGLARCASKQRSGGRILDVLDDQHDGGSARASPVLG